MSEQSMPPNGPTGDSPTPDGAADGVNEPNSQDQMLSYWLRLVDSLITTQINESLEEHGLTRTQWQLMNALTTRPQSVDELGDALPIPSVTDPSDPEGPESVEEHLEELVESGWLVHEGGLYTLTSTGRASGERVAEVVEQLRGRATEGLQEGQYEAMITALRQMAGNLGWSGR